MKDEKITLECEVKNPQPKKRTLKVYTRFSDKITFIALVIGVAISFICGLFIYTYEFQQTQDFWEAGVYCIANQDFKCLLDTRLSQTINKDLFLTILGSNLSFIGLIFGFLSVTLYKACKYE